MRLVMMGTGTFAEPTFEALVGSGHEVVGLVTQPDRAAGEKRGSTRQVGKGMKEIALERGIPVYQPESINTPEGVEQLRAWRPDLLVVAAFGQILSKDVLGTARLGGINVHASLLPKYRGAAPIAWAIYHGESQTGVTIIRMSTALDAGDMLAQEAVAIGPEETAGELEARLGPLGARLALDTVNRYAAGPVSGAPQDKTRATKAPKLTKEHGLIDWSRLGRAVCNQIRAMHPWPTAYTYLHRPGKVSQRVIVTKAAPFRAANFDGSPGEIVTMPELPYLLVGVGDHDIVWIKELQPAGKKRMRGEDFARGHDLKGARLGPEAASDEASPKR
jgi:methionyl-tRNA formyltransferase